MTLRLAVDPSSAADARRFLRQTVTLDSMRHTEADLLITELVGNVVRHAPEAETLTLRVDNDTRLGVKVTLTHPHHHPLEKATPGIGFTLLDRVARDWGHHYRNGKLSVWFRLRAPGTVSRLTELSDKELFERIDEDPAACSGELVERHRDLALAIARRYRGKGIPEEDLEQVALMGLLRAIQRYDAEAGDIRAYASATISGEMKKQLRDRAWSVHVPRPVQERALEVSRAAEELAQELNRPPEPTDIAEHLDMEPEDVAEALSARLAYRASSIHKPVDHSGQAVAEQLDQRHSTTMDLDDKLVLEEAIAELPERERDILDLRFNHDMTQTEIAEMMGISQMHVSRLLSEAIRTLRRQIAARP